MKLNKKETYRKVFMYTVYVLALFALVFIFVFIAMQYGWLNVRGSVSERNNYFNIKKNTKEDYLKSSDINTICKINTLSLYAPLTSINIYKVLSTGGTDTLIDTMLYASFKRFENNKDFIRDINKCANVSYQTFKVPISAYNWADTKEWALLKEVFTRDQDTINRAARDAGISPRLLLGGVIGEQFRFFTNRRDSFKSYFEPYKLLASLSQFSFGIAGLKPETVEKIENNLKDKNSPFYLGTSYEHIVDYKDGVDISKERFNRITNTKDPYYSYFYVGLYMKQIIKQWENQGYDISHRPDVLSTLYNLGFYYSQPKENPVAGGASITVNDTQYTFGDLGYEFYYSGELADIYPFEVQ